MDEAEKQHREKWKMWNEQRQKEEIRKKMDVQEGVENYAANLIQKISDPLSHKTAKQQKELTQKIGSEIESNICSVCLELMLPPERQPIILFPCGHNLCKDCLFERPPDGPIKKNLPLRIQKCTMCRVKIESYALNQSLMALICTYSNNKELLEKQQQRMLEAEANQAQAQHSSDLALRCHLLQKEEAQLLNEQTQRKKQLGVLDQVIDTLKQEKKRNQRDMEKLQEEAKLITKCLNEKLQEQEFSQKRLKDVTDKYTILNRALEPLKKEKEKQQLLEIARLIDKK